MPEAELHQRSLETDLVPGPVEYAVLTPPGYDSATQALPLLLFLHGGGGDRSFLALMQPSFEQAWSSGLLPPVVVATPSAARSFYLDFHDGSERWETLILDELLPTLRSEWNVSHAATLASGVSMGGMGSLRLAFKYPERFAAVAALEPGIEAAIEYDQIKLRDRLYRETAVIEQRYGSPVDAAFWRANHPVSLAGDNAEAIRRSGLSIYVECGDEDSLYLQHGAELLHRELFDAGVPHEYRLVRGADHVGPSLAPRLLDALSFLGRTLRPAPKDEDWQPMAREQFHAVVAQSHKAAGFVHLDRRRIATDGANIEVGVRGSGPGILLIPSLGRGAADFDQLAMRLAASGYTAITPEPRGIGGSRGELEGLTLHDLADDYAAIIRQLDCGPVIAIGHAFGNRVARTLASDHGDLVSGVALLAAGGKVPSLPEAGISLGQCFDLRLPPALRLEAIRTAFFAPGNDPSVWLEGWYPQVSGYQTRAAQATDTDRWWPAGGKPLLVVQALDDTIAPPGNGRMLAESYGERVTLIEIADAGHAMLPEQPDAITKAVLDWISHVASQEKS